MITLSGIEKTRIKLINNKEIRQLTFVPNLQENDMNWIIKLLKAILPFIPYKILGNLLLNWFEEQTKKTENNWDDTALLVLWVALHTLNIADEPPEDLKERAKRLIPTV